MSPMVRLAMRAVIAGVLAFASSLQAAGTDTLNGGDWINAAIAGVLAAAVLAAAELGTPINKTVGLGKPDTGVGK
jgi:hypothetical protein